MVENKRIANTKERDSGFELLRVIAVVLTFMIHGGASYKNNELSAWIYIIIDTVGNTTVPIFTLISGYFGIKPKAKKLLQFEMMILFSGITPFFFFEITQDAGKGIVNMVLMYMIGRYIRRFYEEKEWKRSSLIKLLVLVTGCCVALNGILYVVSGTMQNRFVRENTLFTITEAILIFLIFRGIHFKSRFINQLGLYVPALISMEWILREVITRYMFDYLAWKESNWHQLILFGISSLLLAMGATIEWLRKTLFGRAESKMADEWYELGQKIGRVCRKVGARRMR